jgi:hypothetical protein
LEGSAPLAGTAGKRGRGGVLIRWHGTVSRPGCLLWDIRFGGRPGGRRPGRERCRRGDISTPLRSAWSGRIVIRQAGSILFAEGQENVPGPAAARSELNNLVALPGDQPRRTDRTTSGHRMGTSATPNAVLAVPTWLCPPNSADVTREPRLSASDDEDYDEK